MKAENLMMPQGAAPTGKTASLRSAVQSKTAAQSAKADKNDFGSALDNAKNAQKDAKAEPEKAPKAEAKDAKQPEAKNADAKPADAKETDAKEVSAVEEKVAEAAEEAAELPKNGKKEKTAKTEDGKAAEGVAEIADVPETTGAATTLNAMLMAMAGSAQTQAPLEMQPTMEMPETDVAMSEAMVMPETETPLQSFQTGTLDALLPQDAAKEQQAAQNQQLMDMLSSENSAGMKVVSQTLPSFSTEVQEVVMPTEGLAQQPVLNEAQLSPQAQTWEPSLKMGETILEQPEQTAAVLQNTVQSESAIRDVRTTKNERSDNVNSLFAGVPLTVEDAVLDKTQNPRQNLGDMLNRQPQQQSQQQSAALNEAARNANGEELGGGVQAAERGESQSGAQQAQPQMTGAGVIPQGMSFAETMNAAAPTEAAPAQQVQDPYNVMQQIVDQARLIRSDANTEMVIRLNPEHLGELTLRVAVTASGAVNATFHTENAQVRALLENAIVQLKQELQQQGLKVNNVDVQSGLSQDFFAQSQAGQQGYPQPQHSARNQAADRRSFENDADALTVGATTGGAAEAEPTANAGGSDGVNYLV